MSRMNQILSGMILKIGMPLEKDKKHQPIKKKIANRRVTFLVHIVFGQSGSLDTGFASGFP
jgi:hypothetical protein